MTRERWRRWACAVLLSALGACSSASDSPEVEDPEASGTTTPTPPAAPPPWTEAIRADADPHTMAVASAWSASAVRSECPPLAFVDPGIEPAGTPRALSSGAKDWGVAWDRGFGDGQDPRGAPSTDGRSSYGIRASAAPPVEVPVPGWAHERRWSDGSAVGYGYEGSVNPVAVPGAGEEPNPLGTRKWLAQLSVAGKPCAYEVWSHNGRAHLEHLLDSLRAVDL